MCVKFCFLLGKTAFKDEAMGKTQVYKWFNGPKRSSLLQKNHIVAAFPGAELTKILIKVTWLSFQIVVRPLTKYLK
jgi:hypothetical protein